MKSPRFETPKEITNEASYKLGKILEKKRQTAYPKAKKLSQLNIHLTKTI